MSSSNLICIAEIIGSHGVKGIMKIRVFLENEEDLGSYLPLFREDGTPFPFKIIQNGPKGILIQSSEVLDRTQADALKGMKLYISRENLKPLPKEEYYYTDLIGCEIRDQEDKIRGQVKAVLNYGAGDILEVLLEFSQDPLLIPFRKEFVLEVHIENSSLKEANYIVVDKNFLESERDQKASQEQDEKK